MSAPVLELRDVSRTFARRQARLRRGAGAAEVAAVSQVSLTLAKGETLALVGESGAGKSTIGRMVLGLESPDAGEVLFQGVDLARLHGRARRRVRRRMHLILQDPYQSLHPGMRVGEAVGEPLAIAGVRRDERRERVARALEDVELSAEFVERFPHQLSGGQRQRVAVARSFIAHPELVVADEPTSMLDASLRSEVLRLMAGLRDRLGTTFVLITHDLTAARAFADRVAIMRRGKVIEHGPIDRVLTAPAQQYTRLLLAASEGRLPEEET